jgi:hypothetical protein
MKVGGTQSITTIDGYVLPLDIINGLPHMMARPFSDREWDDYPHVVMTSDGDWNPTVLDNIISNKPNGYAEIDPKSNDTVNNPFNEVGEYMEGHREDPFVYARTGTVDHIEIPWQLCSSQLRHLHKEYVAVEAEKVGVSSKLELYKEPNVDVKDKGTSTLAIDEASVEKYDVLEDEGRSTIEFFETTIEKATRKVLQIKREETRPHLPKEVIEKTLGCATQYYRSFVSRPLIWSTYRSAFSVMRRPESIFTNTIFGKGILAIHTSVVTLAADLSAYTEQLEVDQLQTRHIFVKCGYPPPAGYKLVITRNKSRDTLLDTELMNYDCGHNQVQPTELMNYDCGHSQVQPTLVFQDEGESQMVNPSHHF